MTTVIFSHGKESGPYGSKIRHLLDLVSKRLGMHAISIDYSDLANPEDRVERLLSKCNEFESVVLVGSSMGGYVSICASSVVKPKGLFVLAPALYMPGYANQDPIPVANKIHVVFGYNDEVIPVDHGIRFALKHKVPLTLIPSDHRLNSDIDYIGRLFDLFLDELC